jgi:hypothetical protein
MPRKSKKEEHPNPAMVDSDVLCRGGYKRNVLNFSKQYKNKTSNFTFFLLPSLSPTPKWRGTQHEIQSKCAKNQKFR